LPPELPSDNPANAGNVVLIGMPAAGKSTVGVVLAKRLSLDFLDTDVAIQAQVGKPLQTIFDEQGIDGFRRIEERFVAGLDCRRTVIATGGSVVYSEQATGSLRALGLVVYLHVPLEELRARLTDFGSRGLVRRPEQSLADLYAERLPLYRAAKDIEVACGGMSPLESVAAVVRAVRQAGIADGAGRLQRG